MSAPALTSSTLAGLSPAQWRTLGYLTLDPSPWYSLHHVMRRQSITWDGLCELESAELIYAWPYKLAALKGAPELGYATVHATDPAKRKVSTHPMVRVLVHLAAMARYRLSLCDVVRACDVGADTVSAMRDGQLIDVTLMATGEPVAHDLHRYPSAVVEVRLARKGRHYVPRH